MKRWGKNPCKQSIRFCTKALQRCEAFLFVARCILSLNFPFPINHPHFMKKTFLLILCFLTLTTFAQPANDRIQATDLLKIKTAGNVTASKDGSKAVFTLQSIEPDERSKQDYRYVTQLYLVSLTAPAAPVQLTQSKESSYAPCWSPDGKSLAFVRSVDGKPQVFVLPLNGGEAWQLTRSAYGAGNPRWSPDCSRIVFSGALSFRDLIKDSLLNPSYSLPIWPLEKPGLTVGEWKKPSRPGRTQTGT